MNHRLLAGLVACVLSAGGASAQLLLSANDTKVVLENGAVRTLRESPSDTLTVIDLASGTPRIRAEIAVPASVVGPPVSVAITPDERLALVTATLPTGAAPAGLSINRAGTLALVANRAEGTVGVFRIANGQVTSIGKVEIGPVSSEVSHVAFTPDGRRALVTRYGDHQVNVLQIEGERVVKLDREITTGVRPYGLAVTADGRYAAVANIGRGTGDADTVSLIDLTREPYRIIDTVSVGQTPEGIQTGPDPRLMAVTVMNGSNKPAGSPFAGPGLVKILRIDNGRLSVVSEAQVGTWSQGAAFSPDGRMLFVGNMVEKDISVFRVAEDGKLSDGGPRLRLGGGSVALRTADRPR